MTSEDSTPPGTRRPGGRTAKVRTAVLAATLDELVEHGFGELNLDVVAKRAGVGKTTVYRRWGNPTGLVADLLNDLADQSTTHPDTGSVEGNLRAQAESVLNALTSQRLGPTLEALTAAATCEERTSDALRRFHSRRIKEWTINIDKAVEAGELPAGTDSSEVVRAIAAPLYYRQMVTREPIDTQVADRAVSAALAAARSGAFVTKED